MYVAPSDAFQNLWATVKEAKSRGVIVAYVIIRAQTLTDVMQRK